MGIDVHPELIEKNSKYWQQKHLLRILYRDFYHLIAQNLSNLLYERTTVKVF